MNEKPFWEMSRLEMKYFSRYQQTPNNNLKKKRNITSLHPTRSEIVKTQEKLRPLRTIPKDPTEVIELVGYKPSEYKAFHPSTTFRGLTAPTQYGSREIFKDFHTRPQITKKFNGTATLSVPIKKFESILKDNEKEEKNLKSPIHLLLFDESIQSREEIDPWGYTSDEKVDLPEKKLKGIKLKVSKIQK